ncbi:MAG TPA: SDR family oxidoreductase, partial [Reyranella sp.]
PPRSVARWRPSCRAPATIRPTWAMMPRRAIWSPAEAEPALRKSAESGRPACVVNIGTHAAVRPKGASIPYAAAKAGLHHATRLLALALGPAIRVNCVAPGLVETPMGAEWPEATALWNTKSAMRRPARLEDIADLVAALVANDYVTGEIVIADGGLNLT